MAMVKQETTSSKATKKKTTSQTDLLIQAAKKAAQNAVTATQAAKTAAKSTTKSTKTTTTTPAWDRTENPFPSVTTAKQLNTDYTKLQTARSNYKQAAQNVTDTRKAAQNEYVKLQSGQSTNELYKQTVLKALSAQSSFNQAEQTYNATRQSFERKADKYSGQYQNLLPGAAQSVLKQHSPETQRKKQQFSVASQQASYNSAQKDNENRIKQIDEEIAQINQNPTEYFKSMGQTTTGTSPMFQLDSRVTALKDEQDTLRNDNAKIDDLKLSLPYEQTAFNDPQFSYYVQQGKRKVDENLKTILRNSGSTDVSQDFDAMTDDQRSVYYYLYGKDGDESRAKQYKTYLQTQLNATRMADYTQRLSDYSKEHPFGSSVVSVLSKVAEPAAYAGQVFDYLTDGKIDENASYNKLVRGNSTIRSTVSEKIKDDVGGFWGEVGSFAYQTGMSMFDFLYTHAVGSVVGGSLGGKAAAEKLTLGIMGTGAAASATLEAKDRGLSDTKAFALGTIAGMAEIVSEKVSLETLFDEASMSESGFKYWLQNFFFEGAEEVESDFINLFADMILSKDKSEWKQSLAAYEEQGCSETEALWRAMGDQATEMGLDFLGGAISGGVLAGGNLAINSAQNYAYDRALYHQAVENGKAYYNLNQLSGGELARGNGYMDIEQTYKTDPEARAKYERYQKNQQSEQKFSDEMEQLVKLVPGENEPSGSPAWQAYDAELARLEDEWGADKINAYFGLQSDSSQSQNNAQQNNPLATEGADTAQYSIDPDFANEVEAWSRSGQQSGKQFTLGSTGEVLQGLGAIESDIYMNSEKVTAILEKHPEMTLNEIKRLPEILDDPVLVLKRKGNDATGQNTRLVIFGSVKAQNGQPVLSVLDLRPMENKLVIDDMQKLTSAYTRNNLSSFLQSSDVLYADKKRTTAILRYAGLGSTGELHRSGSMGSISYAGDKVNIQGTPFSQIFQTEESGQSFYAIKEESSSAAQSTNAQSAMLEDSSTVSIPTSAQNVNPEYSISIKQASEVFTEEYLQRGKETVAAMKPVHSVTGIPFEPGKGLQDKVMEYLSKQGVVENPEIGVVSFSKSRIRNDISHGMGAAKAASYISVPSVIRNGFVVDYQPNWKNRGYATAVIAAPVTMNGENYLEGVIVTRTQDENKFYLHEVLTIKEDDASRSTAGVTKKATIPIWGDAPSLNSILKDVLSVNPSSKKYSLRRSRNDVDPATFGRRTMRSRFANNETRRTGILSGVEENIITQAEQLSQAFGTQVVFDDTLARSKEGFYANGTITLNANLTEEQVVRRVFGHELTHSVERAAAYQNLQSFVLSSIGNQTAVQNAINEKIALYRTYGIELDRNGAINELVADFAAEHLFSDEQTVRRLATQHQSLATRILTWIRKTLAQLTGNTEKTALLHAERLYFKVLAQVQQSESRETARFSLRAFEDGKRFVRVDTDQHLFDGLTDSEKMKQAVKIIKSRFAGRVIGTENQVFVNGRSAEEFGHPAKHLSSDMVNAKMRASTELENLLDAGTNLRSKPDGEYGHMHKNSAGDFEYLDVIFQVGDNYYEGTINIQNTERGRLLKDVTKIEDVTQSLCSSYGETPKSTSLRNITNDSIPNSTENVNPEYSISYDSTNTPFVEVDTDILAGVPKKQWVSAVKQNLKEKFPNGVTVGNNLIKINAQTANEMTKSRYSQWIKSHRSVTYKDKLRATNHVDEILQASRNYVGEGLNHPRADNIKEFARGTVNLRIGGNDYSADVVVGTTKGNSLVLYDIIHLQEVKIKESSSLQSRTSERRSRAEGEGSAFTSSIPTSAQNVNTKFSIDPDFANEVEAWSRSGQQSGKQFVLGSTGEVLQGLGAIEGDIYMNSEKVTAILEKHPEMTLNEIKRLPEILDDPVLVLKSKGADRNGDNSRLIIFGSVKAQNSRPVMSILDLRPVENRLIVDDMQKLTSAYTKTTKPAAFLQNSEVLYADKKRTTAILRHAGYSVTGKLLRSGSTGSISYADGKVNIQGTPFSQIFQAEESTPQFSIDPTFETELRQWDGKERRTFSVGTTSKALQSIGVEDRNIIWHSAKIAKILAKHSGMTIDVISQVPHLLENPVVVTKSKNSDSRILLFGELTDSNGAPVTAVLELQPTSKGGELLDLNVVASAYGKDSNLAGLIRTSEILYLDQNKNRTEAWLQNQGLISPLTEAVSDSENRTQEQKQGVRLQLPSDTNVLGSTGSISYADGKVNIQGTPFSQIFQTEESTPQYSINPTADKTPAELKKENRKLTKQNERLAKENEQLTRQMTRTKPHTPSRSKLTGITDAFLTGYASRMDSDTLYDKLEDLYRCRTSGSATIGDVVIDYTEQNAKNDARHIAQELLESSEAAPTDLDAEVENLAKEILNRMTDVPDAAPTFADKKAAEFAREHAKRIRAEENEKKARAAERVAKSAAKTAEQRGAERERQRRAELDAKARERKQLTELKDKLFQKLQWIRQNRHRAPEDLRTVFDAILNDINTYSKRQLDPNRYSERYGDTWNNVMNDYQQARKSGQILQNKEIEKLIARRDLQAIDTLDVSALEDLVEAAVMLQKDLQDRNRLLELDREMETDEAAKNIIHEMDNAVGKGRDQVVATSRFKEYRTLWMLTPDHIFEWLSGWNKNSTLYQLGKTISTGERKMKDYEVRAKRLMNDFVKDKGNRKWLRRADGQGKHGIWYELELQQYEGLDENGNVIYGDTVTVHMTPMQKVHLYLESLNEDNLRHIQNGGRTFANRELYEDGQRQEAFAQGTTVRIEPEKVRSIVSDLTAEEKAYAQLLSFYYNEFAAVQINHVSNILYGHDKAMTKSYAPIFTNSNYNSKEFGVFDRTVEGAGHLKERTYGGNPTLNIGASDAFDKHVAQTSRFVGLAIPLRNWKYVMNWQSKGISLRDELTHHYGKKVLNYVEELLTELESGGTQKQRGFWDKRLNSMLNNYITAVFGANPAIGLKQAASFPSFAAELGWKNLSIGLRNLPKVNEKLIDAYTSELAIRKMGYSTPEIAALKDNPGLLQRNKFLNVTFGGGHITAIDALTVKAGWAIAIEKVKNEYPNLEHGSQAQVENGESPFYQKVAEVWEEAVANTQPMYDTMHRAKIMKAETGVGRAFTLFKTVPVQTYNYVYQKFGELSFASKNLKRAQKSGNADLVKGARKLKWKAAMGAAGALNSMIISNLALETVEFSMQLWKNAGKYYRDDDDELTAESVIEQILLDTLIDMAGSMPGADILVESIANFLMQQTGSDLTSPGVEQFNEFMDQMNRIGTAVCKFIKEAEDIRRNGGDLGEFLKRSGGDYAGVIKDTIFLLAKYTSGLPLENVEKYVLGTVRIISPELYAAIENFFDTTTKEDLAGLKGAQLTQTIHDTMETRRVTVNDKTVSTLEKLYSAGYTAAIPSDTTSTIKLDEDSDEKVELSAYQKQVYDKKWSSVVNKGINELTTQKLFTQADEKTQAAMLNQLYTYAGEQAKHAVFSDYDGGYDIERAEQSVKYCKSVSLFAAWRGASSSATAEEKNNLIAQLPLTDTKKLQFYESEVKYNSSQSAIDTLEEQVKAVAEVGIGFDEYLKIATKKDSFEGKGENTRLEFTHWLDQTYTAEQAQAIKEALYAKPASYDKMITAGMDEEKAYTLTTSLASIEPLEGKSSVSQTQKYAYIAFSPDYTSEEKRQAFTALLTDDEYAKYNAAWETAGISTEAYMDYKLTSGKLTGDKDENGKTISGSKRLKVLTYIDGISGLSNEQKDYLYYLQGYSEKTISSAPWYGGERYSGTLPEHYNVTEESVQRIMGTAATDTSTESGWAKSSKTISTRTGKSTASTSTKSATSTAYKSTSAVTKSGLSSARSKTAAPKASTVSAPRTSLTVGSSKSKIKPLTISSYLNSFLPSPQAIGEENESSRYYI